MALMQTPFEPITVYDKPNVLLTQLVDGEFTKRGALQTLVDADGLSPQERDSYVTRLKEGVGRNVLTDTLIDTLTNPFVLLLAVTTPVGGSMLSRAGQSIFSRSARFSPFLKEQGGLHGVLGMLSPTVLFQGTGITPAIQSFGKGVKALEEEMLTTVTPHLSAVLKKHGLNSLNPEKVSDPAKKALVEEISFALHASLEGLHKTRTMVRGRLKGTFADDFAGKKKISKAQKVELLVTETEIPAMIQTNPEDAIQRLGLGDLRDAFKQATDVRRVRMFGKDDVFAKTGKFEADDQKLLRQLEGMKLGYTESGALSGSGSGFAAGLMGPEMEAAMRAGKVSPTDMLVNLRKVIDGQSKNYVPRNLIESVGERSIPLMMEQKRSSAFMASGAALHRSSRHGAYAPEDMRKMFGYFGATDDGIKSVMASEKMLKAVVARGDTAKVFRINPFEAMNRHFRDTGISHGLFVQTVSGSPRTAQAIKDTMGQWNPEKAAELGRILPQSAIMDGEVSIGKALYQQHFMLEGNQAKEALEVVLRQSTGRTKIEHAVSHMAMVSARGAMNKFLDSPVGKILSESGPWGKQTFDKLKHSVTQPLGFGEAKSAAGTLAKYFYVTHLGLNMASVAMNTMQPFLLASVYGGLPNVLKGYKEAFKEMGGYMSERVSKYGVRSLNDLEHSGLITKHFKFANVEGENLMNIGRDVFQSLDEVSFSTAGLNRIGRKESYFFDYPMKLFEKAEWINRSVAAHSVEAGYLAAGRKVTKGSEDYYRMLTDVDAMVGSTQFGGSIVNTPMAFLGQGPLGRAGNNPLMRQFLSFPVRSVTGVSYQSGMLGDRGAAGVGMDLLRGMGISAIMYEAGKNILKADLSPALFESSMTQLVGGDRFFQDGNEYIPIPPVIDIPVNLLRGILDPGQRELLQNTVPRMIPGGIALSRSINLLPNLSDNPLTALGGSLQKTYVDWEGPRTQEGYVGVFKGDGTLIDYASPGSIVAKSIGLDLGSWKSTADFDGFLIKNRDQIVEYRRRMVQALMNNEVGKATGVRDEFQKRFGIPLTVTKAQLDEAYKSRSVSRSERMLDRMPPDIRPQFLDAAKSRAEQMNLTPDDLANTGSSKARAFDRRLDAVQLDPETVQSMQQLVAQDKANKAASEGFAKFAGYEGAQ